ncbi:MAG: AAA family ATPase [Syntrophaceae bacterium]
MKIEELHVSNFKTFENLDLTDLNNFSVLIGANSSGKSNFIQIFRFLKDISRSGLRNAVSLQGGIEYLKNTRLGPKEISIKLVYDPGLEVTRKKGALKIRYRKFTYGFDLELTARGRGYRIKRDCLEKEMEFPAQGNAGKSRKLLTGRSILCSSGGKITYELDVPRGVKLKADDVIPPFLKEESLPPDSLLLESSFFSFFHRFERFFDKIAIYDFDPKLPKRSVTTRAKVELEENGSNLAIVLKDILEDPDRKRKFSNLLRDLLPFFEDLEVENITDKSLIMKLRELYNGNRYMPAPFISDGTINMINMIVALYFEDKSLVIMEEPERSIHPALISRMIEMMKDASCRKQIILTTHNPEIVRAAGPRNIYLVSRDRTGFSTVSRPYEKEEIRAFLENDIKIEDLYTKDLLGI